MNLLELNNFIDKHYNINSRNKIELTNNTFKFNVELLKEMNLCSKNKFKNHKNYITQIDLQCIFEHITRPTVRFMLLGYILKFFNVNIICDYYITGNFPTL